MSKEIDISKIRNFSIIAHIDHGKSTLADRLLERTGLLKRERVNDDTPVLDSMPVEKKHGITVKSQAVTLEYKAKDGNVYVLNLIDTPGHVDFNYEVSRALAACEGVLLLVDASQGVQAQTILNYLLALENNLVIIPVINKIDLPVADVEGTKLQIEEELGLNPEEAILVSAKEGWGIDELLEAIVKRIPPPKGDPHKPLKALVFDSYYDNYKGVVVKIRVFDGAIKPGDKILFMQAGKEYEVEEVGFLRLDLEKTDMLVAGEVGYITANIKSISDFRVGDTITLSANPTPTPLPGYKEPKPMVFANIFPVDPDKFPELKETLLKLRLTDSSVSFEPTTSVALGSGFKCGFLGLLHAQIVAERLQTEYNMDVIITFPTVKYKIILRNGEEIEIDNPIDFPDPSKVEKILEPYARVTIITPNEYLGNVMQLMVEKKATHISTDTFDAKRLKLIYEMPLSELIFGFFDKLKAVTKGYASLDYEIIGYKEGDIVKMDILLNGKPVDALSMFVHREDAYRKGREIVKKLKELIPKHLFHIAIQAAIGSKVIAREDISALRKDVTAKCYGGDMTRKLKLLEKQKEGKKRMKAIGQVNVPQEAFIEILKINT